jgi:hypothetical protein
MNSCALDACSAQTYYRGTVSHFVPIHARPIQNDASTKKKNTNGAAADDIVIPDKLYFRIGEVARSVRSARLRAALLGDGVSAA